MFSFFQFYLDYNKFHTYKYFSPLVRLPVYLARLLGETTARYPWFGGFYLLLSFVLVPGLVFLFSLAGPLVFYIFLAVVATLAGTVGLLTLLQHQAAAWLPPRLRTWDFLPPALRSLAPYDAALSRLFFCCNGRGGQLLETADDVEAGGGGVGRKFGSDYDPVLGLSYNWDKVTSSARTPIVKNLSVVGAIPQLLAEEEPILVTTTER